MAFPAAARKQRSTFPRQYEQGRLLLPHPHLSLLSISPPHVFPFPGSSCTPKSPANPASEEENFAQIYLARKGFKTMEKGSSPAAGACLGSPGPCPTCHVFHGASGILQSQEMNCVTATHQDPLQGTSQPGSPLPARPHGPQTPETSKNEQGDGFLAFPLNFISSLGGG